jgi:hypothetical protein
LWIKVAPNTVLKRLADALTRISHSGGCHGDMTGSQRETQHDRALSRAFALRRKIGAEGGIGDYFEKPKGMHWRTFELTAERIYRAEKTLDEHTMLLIDRLRPSS